MDYATTPGSATSPSDFTSTSGTLNFADGQDGASFNVPITDDNIAELAESFTVNLSNPTGGVSLGAQSSATVTIYDNDGTAPTGVLLNELDVNPPSSVDGPHEYVELLNSAGTSQSLNDVYFLSIEGDATSAIGNVTYAKGFNGALNSNQLAILEADSGGPTAPGGAVVFQDPLLDATAGALQNGTNTFILVYSQTPITSNTDLDASNGGTLTLPPGAVLLDAVGWKDATTGTPTGTDYYVDLPLPNAVPGAATRIVGNTTATSASAWYYGASDFPHQRPNHADLRPVSVGRPIPAGRRPHSGRANYVGTGNTSGQISFAAQTSAVIESGGSITLTVTRAAGSTGQVSVDYVITDGTADLGQEYNDPSDYLGTHGTITFADGDTSPKTITIPILDDSIIEPNKSFTVTLSNPQNLSTPGSNIPIVGPITTDTVTIADDDTKILLNEILVNAPPLPNNTNGSDTSNEYIELEGTPGQTLQNVYVVSVEGDGTAAGTVTAAFNLSGVTVGTNGLIMLKSATSPTLPDPTNGTTVVHDVQFDNPGGTLQNGSNSFLVVLSPTAITTSSNLDPDLDGNLNLPEGAKLADGIGWYDTAGSDHFYGAILPPLTTAAPQAATRFPTDTDPLSVGAWYYGNLVSGDANFDYTTDGTSSNNLPAGGKLTPGDINFPAVAAPTLNTLTFNYDTTNQNITLDFSTDVFASFSTDDFTLTQTNSPSFVVPSANIQINHGATANEIVLTFTNYPHNALPDGRYTLLVNHAGITDSSNNVLAADGTLNFFVLSADANHDGKVNALDFNALATHFGQSANVLARRFRLQRHGRHFGLHAARTAVQQSSPRHAPVAAAVVGSLFSSEPVGGNVRDVLGDTN